MRYLLPVLACDKLLFAAWRSWHSILCGCSTLQILQWPGAHDAVGHSDLCTELQCHHAITLQGHVACPMCAGWERPLHAEQASSATPAASEDDASEASDLTWLDDL